MPLALKSQNRQTTIAKKTSIFLAEVLAFNEFNTSTAYYEQNIEDLNIPFYVNEFWTSKQRAANSLHEVSYRACFKPQLPRFFIERLSNKGDTVYDPFMGRGTTILEAALMERSPIGNDINPLSKIFCGPRIHPPSLEEIQQRLEQIPFHLTTKISQQEKDDLSAFYHAATIKQLCSLRSYLLKPNRANDAIDQWIQMVATNRLTGHSSGFFSVYTLPPNQAVTAKRQRKINQKRQQAPERKDIPSIILKKSKALLSKLTIEQQTSLSQISAQLETAPAESTPNIPSSSVDLIITSPPFLDVIDYKSDNWLRCWFNGIDASTLPISQLKKPEEWVAKMTSVFHELSRILTKNGVIAFEVGEVRGGKLLLEELVVKAAHQAKLTVHAVIINDQKFTKTANCWGVENQNKGTNTNRIVILSL